MRVPNLPGEMQVQTQHIIGMFQVLQENSWNVCAREFEASFDIVLRELLVQDPVL